MTASALAAPRTPRQRDPSDALLQRGMRISTQLPAGLAAEARHLVSMGIFGSMDEFLFVSVSAYLDLRSHPELLALVEAGQATDPADLVFEAVPVWTSIPGHMAVQAARLVAGGPFATLDAFLVAAASAYLHLRADYDLMSALDTMTVDAAFERSGLSLREVVASVSNRLSRLPPLDAAEAVEAMRWTGAKVA